MRFTITPKRELFKRDPMIYGHFLEHFHRQIYGGVFEPGSPLSDEDGFRKDVLEALRKIRTPLFAGREAALYLPTIGKRV